ncbi:MAG: ATP-binding protein [Planctomycetota bacterium]|nr:ATP-binding protein [Planctomycetota bacterium]
MIRLFLKLFILLMVVLLAIKWTFEKFLEMQVYSDRDRIVAGLVEVQLDGLRSLSKELLSFDEPQIQQQLEAYRQEFDIPLRICPIAQLSRGELAQLQEPDGFVYEYYNGMVDYLGVPLGPDTYLRLGPLSDQTLGMIENEVATWLRIQARKIDTTSLDPIALDSIQRLSRFPLKIRTRSELPSEVSNRFSDGKNAAFYRLGGDSFVALLLKDQEHALSMGPLPTIIAVAQKVGRRSLTFWFLISACLIAGLVFNVSNKFRRIEDAAKQIALGKLDTRVDVHRAGEAKVLALAFNSMAEKTEGMIRAKKDMLHVVSHELRTPLARLRFGLELMDTAADESQKKALRASLDHSIEELDAIVAEVLEYVRNENSATHLERVWIGVQQAFLQTIRGSEQQAIRVEFQWVFPDDPPQSHVFADQIAFHRVLGNLVSNALRYARRTICIRVYRVPTSPGKTDVGQVCLEVQDDGPGIAPEDCQRMLEPFVRLEGTDRAAVGSQASNHAGLGLGLAIVDRILQQHGGQVTIDQGSLGGCRVRTYWPTTGN